MSAPEFLPCGCPEGEGCPECVAMHDEEWNAWEFDRLMEPVAYAISRDADWS